MTLAARFKIFRTLLDGLDGLDGLEGRVAFCRQ
jgi:hypothetical protein